MDRPDDFVGQFHQAMRGRGVRGDGDKDFIFRAAYPSGFATRYYVSTGKRFHEGSLIFDGDNGYLTSKLFDGERHYNTAQSGNTR